MSAQVQAASRGAMERLRAAMNEHDLDALLACLSADYRSEQPVHPQRGFSGREQVKKNWSAMFEGIPDFHAELLSTATEGDTVWAEWRWTGTRATVQRGARGAYALAERRMLERHLRRRCVLHRGRVPGLPDVQRRHAWDLHESRARCAR